MLCLLLLEGLPLIANDPFVAPITGSDMGKLFGRSISLVDAHRIENYSFGKNGIVLAEFGLKGGYDCAPAFNWSLSAKGVLTISDTDSGLKPYLWTGIGFSKENVYVETDGKVKVFIFSK